MVPLFISRTHLSESELETKLKKFTGTKLKEVSLIHIIFIFIGAKMKMNSAEPELESKTE